MDPHDRSGITRRRFLRQVSLGGVGAVGVGLLPGAELAAAKERLARAPQEPLSVLVVGAGLAGLAAAWELDDAGHDVKVLEARTRPGGRVHTLRDPFSGDLFAETGAVAFSETYTEAIRYIEALGLERGPWDQADLAGLFHVNGERLVVDGNTPVRWPYDLTEDERGLGPMGIMQKYLFETLPVEIGSPESWSEPPLSDLDGISLAAYMRRHGASEGAVAMIADTQFFGPRIERTSTLSSALSEFGLFFGGAPFVLVNGNDRLPLGMAERLGRSVKYGLEVTGIRDTGEGVEVMAKRGDRVERYEADRAVCAVPLGVLRQFDIAPRMPEEKRIAVAQMPYIDATRTFLQVDRAFWYDEGVSGVAATDLPVGLVYRHPFGDAAGPEERSIVEGYVIDAEAESQATRSDAELVELMVLEMEKVHPGFAEHFEGAAVKAWGRDPYAMGHVSWPGPGDVTAHLRALQRAHGRIHFAGEHTTALRGTMEGALRSGIRAAGEVSESA